jgi:hypothetical protein
VKSYRVAGDTVHVRLYERREEGEGGCLVETEEYDPAHPYCRHEHLFLVGESRLDADLGEPPDDY